MNAPYWLKMGNWMLKISGLHFHAVTKCLEISALAWWSLWLWLAVWTFWFWNVWYWLVACDQQGWLLCLVLLLLLAVLLLWLLMRVGKKSQSLWWNCCRCFVDAADFSSFVSHVFISLKYMYQRAPFCKGHFLFIRYPAYISSQTVAWMNSIKEMNL